MIFTSLTFAIFASLVICLYWALTSYRSQNCLLLIASYFFYGWWDWRFCSLILASSLLDYVIARRIDGERRTWARRSLLAASVVANVGLLAVFKYFHFFAESFQALCASIGWPVGTTTLSIILPVGISFYTFQTLSYTIDVSRKRLRASRNLIEYLTFVSFFPQLVAGPIERATSLLPQFASPRKFDLDFAVSGCRLILWGVVKKMLIADNLAAMVDPCYAASETVSGSVLALATFLFAFQIYCDFSAYSDIAIGTARILGIRLMRNFAYPYFSQSVAEFWHRWHISLSTWFRDYVYIPLGGSRCGTVRAKLNVIATFLVSGFWHGAAWQYLFWGGLNGISVAANRRTYLSDEVVGGAPDFPGVRTMLRMARTMVIICIGWVFFRASTIAEGVYILKKIGSDAFSWESYAALAHFVDGERVDVLIILSIFIGWEWAFRRKECPLEFELRYRPMRWAIYSVLLWTTLLYWPVGGTEQFIYFDF
jgi:D-alanyl-lipoteichoic acid acyltransferase DltB (MBOAT superfamily)